MKKAIIINEEKESDFKEFLNLKLFHIYSNYQIINLSNCEKLYSNKLDLNDNSILVLPSSLQEKKREWIISYLNIKKRNVFIYDINMLKHFLFNGIDVNENVISKYLDYHWIDKVQIPIALHCNLKCNRCYHFSNLQSQKEFYDFDNFKKDINDIKDMRFKIFEFRFLGGEPLLCDDILKYVEYTKQIYPYSDIKIITNGILLLSKSDDFLKKISKFNIIISISLYQPMISKINIVEERLKKYNINYEIFRFGDSFNKILKKECSEDYEVVASNCEKCILIYNGVISRCAPSIFINIFNSKFNYNYPEKNYKKIIDFENRKALLKYINKPVELCKYCSGDSNPVSFKWEHTPLKPSADDYIRE